MNIPEIILTIGEVTAFIVAIALVVWSVTSLPDREEQDNPYYKKDKRDL